MKQHKQTKAAPIDWSEWDKAAAVYMRGHLDTKAADTGPAAPSNPPRPDIEGQKNMFRSIPNNGPARAPRAEIKKALRAVRDAQEALALASVAAVELGADPYEIDAARMAAPTLEAHAHDARRREVLDQMQGFFARQILPAGRVARIHPESLASYGAAYEAAAVGVGAADPSAGDEDGDAPEV